MIRVVREKFPSHFADNTEAASDALEFYILDKEFEIECELEDISQLYNGALINIASKANPNAKSKVKPKTKSKSNSNAKAMSMSMSKSKEKAKENTETLPKSDRPGIWWI